MESAEIFLKPTYHIDSDNENIIKKAEELTAGCTNDREKAVSLFKFVRDEIPYNLYMISVFREDFVSSRVLEWGKGYCVQKAVLLASLGRAAGIPSRIAFAAIKNHTVPAKVLELTGDNIFPRHGYNEFFIEGKWVCAAATFNRTLCEKKGLPVVEFNGREDAFLPSADLSGNPYIEYVEKFGSFDDLPFDWIREKIMQKVGAEKRPWLSKSDIQQAKGNA
ncbi:MAG TPA: transglutaminase family protein [Spirochaetota bacterium]|nr:transglutaminase family protein [Spirochaetota bacterium]HPJ34087.1 transglutaminase family protein [Spirochaetota bacterium]